VSNKSVSSKKILSRRKSLFGLGFVVGALLFFVAPGCSFDIAGQRVPSHAFTADSENFDVADDVVALHYYGVGGWGVKWRGEYLLTAPYFSNHGLVGMFGKRGPDTDAIRAGILNTPFAHAGMILVGHGHIDHAADIPGYSAVGLHSEQAGVIAGQTTLNMLAKIMPPNATFRCSESPSLDGIPLDDCLLPGFRITPLASDHAPNVKMLGFEFTLAEGSVDQPMSSPPSRPSAYKLGKTWAYLIDLLDESGDIVFRIHYMDAVAGAEESHIPSALIAEHPVDVHIACVPGYHYANNYPEWAIDQGEAGFVLMGHWEHFFHPRENRLKPVSFVLSENKLQNFVDRIEAAMAETYAPVRPINKSESDCPVDEERCGPLGETWALPIPGETYHFSASQ